MWFGDSSHLPPQSAYNRFKGHVFLYEFSLQITPFSQVKFTYKVDEDLIAMLGNLLGNYKLAYNYPTYKNNAF